MAKLKVMKKDLATKPGIVTIEVINGTKGAMNFDPKVLPDSVRVKLPAIALSHILGDSAAGKNGKEAEDNIIKKWEAMSKGEMTTRAPAQPKINLSAVAENYAQLPDNKKAAAKALLESLGVALPV